MRHVASLAAALAAPLALAAAAQDVRPGTLVESVASAHDPAETYALYLPSRYDGSRAWPVLIAFHPAARGRVIVETYQAAAEQYGFIVAGSNTSRNGPWERSEAAVVALSTDLPRRVSIDPRRVYLAGHSGGARVALRVALTSDSIAGVIASSGGYPDSEPRRRLPFPVFATAGTEDFNYVEMRRLDRALESPHRLAVFEGGHTLPPEGVAREAIEWLELQAMRTGRRARDEALIDRLLDARRNAAAAASRPAEALRRLRELVADFEGLRDVTADAARAAALDARPDVRAAAGRERDLERDEVRVRERIIANSLQLGETSLRGALLSAIRDDLARLADRAKSPDDSPERQMARRVLRFVAAESGRVNDLEFRMLLERYGAVGRR